MITLEKAFENAINRTVHPRSRRGNKAEHVTTKESILLLRWLRASCLAIFVTLLLVGPAVHAQPSSANSISFQGALTGAGGQPLANGNYNLTFKFYDVPTGGTALATSNVPNVPVTGGIASAPIPVDAVWFNGQTRYLGIGINGGAELEPRVMISSVPYATYALTTRGIAVDSNGRVGIGTSNLYGALKLVGDSSQPALVIGHSNPSVPPLQLIPLGWAEPSGALQWGLFTPFAHSCGAECGPDALIYWNGNALSFGSPEGGRPLFKVGIGTRTPQSELEVVGTARMTVCQITSDRAAKKEFKLVDAQDVLAKVASLPISTWAYTNAAGIRHIGPVAQDFQAAFAVGEDDKHIATVDADGVALAAIQGLHQLVQEKEAKIQALENRLGALERKLDSSFVANERP